MQAGDKGAEENTTPAPYKRFDIKHATRADVVAALSAGITDLKARPGLSLFFGLVYAGIGIALLSGLFLLDQLWIAIAAGVGFPLVAPFVAAGLYEMSRRMQNGEAFAARDIFAVVFRQQRREFGWMAFVMLFVFWIWAYQVRLLLAIFLQWQSFSSLGGLFEILVSTPEGIGFLVVGTAIGAVISTVLFSITVIAMPLLLDKEVDFVTAMITSVSTVAKSPQVMLGWGAVIGAMVLLAVAPFCLGVIVVFPLLGHTTWHLYRRLITEP